MNLPYVLQPHTRRFVTFFAKDDAAIPAELFQVQAIAPNLTNFPYPLPSRKQEYCCFAQEESGVFWYGASTGLTRYEKDAARPTDRVQYFSAERDLPDNCVKAVLAHKDDVWVLTESGVAHIVLRMMDAKELADILLEETLQTVSRRGMVSQRGLDQPGDFNSKQSYAHSDNDGCFTAGFSIGEMFHYAVLAREKGENDPETQCVRGIATKAAEACLLLMCIAARGNGFIARTYLTKDEPVPDDGLFFRKIPGGKAVCVETNAAKRKGMIGMEIDASAPIPERLAKLYRDEGYADDEITYKADTSSDEVSLHYLHLYFLHEILGKGDPELDALAQQLAKDSMTHFLDHGFELHDCTGKPTTWAKWSLRYFADGLGWYDSCLNAAEFLMYLRVTMHITGETGRWLEAYQELASLGYPDLIPLHQDRFWQASIAGNFEPREDLMYGDNMLATAAFWGLIPLETNEEYKKKFQQGYRSWRNTLAQEHNPAYDFPYLLCCPEQADEIDFERIADWFYRFNPSRLASSVSTVGRHDIAKKILWGGYEECSALLPPDENFIAKYDRNPLEYRNEDSGGRNTVESCYVYTNAYWMGRYYGFIR